jgi:hypothetical protein
MSSLSKAIESIAAKAEKQFRDTGTLQGFSASCRRGASHGVTGLSVSAVETANQDGLVLAYTLDVSRAAGTPGAARHGLSVQQIEDLMDLLSNLRSAAR